MKTIRYLTLAGFLPSLAFAAEIHVSATANDAGDGSAAKPFKTISAAAQVAQPGDIVTVHTGVYRERIDPPRGGESDAKRIVYQAVSGEKVVIKGSEPAKGWEKVQNDTWKLVLPNKSFGAFNPYRDAIQGDWFNGKGRTHHTGAVYLNGHWLTESASLAEVMKPVGDTPVWYTDGSADTTTIWAQFKGIDPNQADVEINVRQTVFYPEKTGINFLTIRGFTMEQAATPWAPPTAEQIGLIGTNWSKGWIIENNTVRYSTCSGIALGKHGDEFDNTSANSAEGYVKTIERATARGWSKENIGHHIVRNNHVSDCEQAGVVGSLGAVFSTITGNHIHHIHMRQLFTGAEQAGIKIHAAIDTLIADNHIHHTNRGLWLDWMAQGTRVSRNLFHDNNTCEDLFIEVDHGPMLVENNLFLSRVSLLDMSEGAAFVHNLFTGRIVSRPEPNRETPYHPAHSTVVAGLSRIKGGDNRFYNNVFSGPTCGLTEYDARERPSVYGGNVFLNGAKPSAKDAAAVVVAADPKLRLTEESGSWHLQWTQEPELASAKTVAVTTDLLGKAAVSGVAYENPDGSPLAVDADFSGSKRDGKQPTPGPIERPGTGELKIKLK